MKRWIPPMLALLMASSAAHAQSGSLYDEGTFSPLAGDNRARRVGDAITVRVYENSSASSSTETATERKNDLNAQVGIIGVPRQYGGSASINGQFEGGGTTQRANRLLATLTATVIEVLPGGDLRVSGEQLVTVNQEEQRVTVEGRARSQDISGDNVILSTRLADARITFHGLGPLSARQRRAWWRSILDFLGF